MDTVLLRHKISRVTTAYSVDYATSLLADPHYSTVLEEVEPDPEEGCVDCLPDADADKAIEVVEPAKTPKDEKK